jgi:hypothetical protein
MNNYDILMVGKTLQSSSPQNKNKKLPNYEAPLSRIKTSWGMVLQPKKKPTFLSLMSAYEL